MSRVLFWSELFWPDIGGPQVMALKLLKALQKHGHEFIVVTNAIVDLPNESMHEGISIRRFAFHDAFSRRDINELASIRQNLLALRKTFRPDLVHIYFLAGPGVVLHRQTAVTSSAPVLVTLHAILADQLLQPGAVLGSIVRSANWVTACSAAALRESRRQAPEIIPRSSLVYHGPETPLESAAALPFGTPRVVSIGRLSPEKGFDVGLRAFASLLHRFPKARLIIAGDGPVRAQLEHEVAELGITNAVDMDGWLAPEGIPALINTSSLVLIPSWREGLPIVGIQAGQMARPVVATRVGGVPELVLHGETGLLVDAGDSHALAESMAFLLDHPDTAAQMGRAARERTAAMFSSQREVEAYDTLYRELRSGLKNAPLVGTKTDRSRHSR